MKRQKFAAAPIDSALARYDSESAFPCKVEQAKAMLANINLAKLDKLLAKPQQTPV